MGRAPGYKTVKERLLADALQAMMEERDKARAQLQASRVVAKCASDSLGRSRKANRQAKQQIMSLEGVIKQMQNDR